LYFAFATQVFCSFFFLWWMVCFLPSCTRYQNIEGKIGHISKAVIDAPMWVLWICMNMCFILIPCHFHCCKYECVLHYSWRLC
jgi:hypothetical protein